MNETRRKTQLAIADYSGHLLILEMHMSSCLCINYLKVTGPTISCSVSLSGVNEDKFQQSSLLNNPNFPNLADYSLVWNLCYLPSKGRNP